MSKYVMIVSSLFLGILGVIASFFSDELLEQFDGTSGAQMDLIIQLTGALFLGNAMINWTSKGSILGGIYGRAIVIGNFTHFAIGSITLIKVIGSSHGVYIWVLLILYAILALAFGKILFGSPKALK